MVEHYTFNVEEEEEEVHRFSNGGPDKSVLRPAIFLSGSTVHLRLFLFGQYCHRSGNPVTLCRQETLFRSAPQTTSFVSVHTGWK